MAELQLRTSVSPYLVAADPAAVVRFLSAAVEGAERFERHLRPDGSIMHTQVTVGDSVIMIGGAEATMPSLAHIYVPDVDVAYRAALDAGATSIQEPKSEVDGDRRGGVDFQGLQFWVSTRAH